MFGSLPQYPPEFWVCAVISVLLIGISKAGFGAGIGVIATPLMALTIPTATAAAILLPLLIFADFMAIFRYKARFDRRNLLILVPGALLGIVIGWLFFGYFRHNERILKIGIGILAIGFVVFQLAYFKLKGITAKQNPAVSKGVFWGVLSGFSSTLAHVGSPPVMVYLLPQNMPRGIYVGTTIYFFAITNVVKLIPYYQLNLLHVWDMEIVLLLLPAAFFGVWLGYRLNNWFSDTWFKRFIYGLLFLTGVQLILGIDLIHLFHL